MLGAQYERSMNIRLRGSVSMTAAELADKVLTKWDELLKAYGLR